MEKKAEFIDSITQNIHRIFAEYDLTQYSSNDFKNNFRTKIVNLANDYNFLPEVQEQVENEVGEIHYIDVVWFVGPVPYVSFLISTSFHTRRVMTLLRHESFYRFFIHCGTLSKGSKQILEAVDVTGDIILIELPNYRRKLLKKPAWKQKKVKEGINCLYWKTTNSEYKYQSISQKAFQKKINPSILITYDLFQQGLSLQEIAEQRGLTSGTIAQHLVKVMETGSFVNVEKIVPEAKRIAIVQTAQELNTKRLTPIKEALGDEYSWDEIRLALAYDERCDLFE